MDQASRDKEDLVMWDVLLETAGLGLLGLAAADLSMTKAREKARARRMLLVANVRAPRRRAWELLNETDLISAINHVYHPDDAHKLKCLLIHDLRTSTFVPNLSFDEDKMFVMWTEYKYREWCTTLHRVPTRGDNVRWVPEMVGLPPLFEGEVDKVEDSVIRTVRGTWVDPRNVVWLSERKHQ